MAFKFNDKNNNNQAHFDLVKYGAAVTNPRQISDNCIVFTLRCGGFSLYNMHIVEGKDGKRFVTPPASKGNDGKYYNEYAIYLSKEDELVIIDAVLNMLGGDGNDQH